MNPKSVMIDGAEYREVVSPGERMSIVICDNRGLTFVGLFDRSDTGDWVVIRDARCIIRWGTTRHLAELGDGPLDNTKLGAPRDVIVSSRNIVAIYDCGEGWQ